MIEKRGDEIIVSSAWVYVIGAANGSQTVLTSSKEKQTLQRHIVSSAQTKR